MQYNFQQPTANSQQPTCQTYLLNSSKFNSYLKFFTETYFSTQSSEILRIFARSLPRSSFRSYFGSSFRSSFRSYFRSFPQLSRQIVFSVALFLPFSGHALTSQTTRNAIQGSAPYLTFDGGRTRVVDTNGLLAITLSDGAKYTPSTNSSSTTPIVLPVAGQSFADIAMLVPTNTNAVTLSELIGPPNNYWGDDDGDSGVTATGFLSLSIVDKYNQSVSRNSVLTTCNAPYRIKLSSTDGTLSTRYGFPNRSTFSASRVTYYVNPKAGPAICFARPNLKYGKLNEDGISHDFRGPVSMWDPANGFLTQKTDPSLYGQNFPTTGANNLYFDLLISGVSQPLSWSPVSLGGITVTMSNPTATSVRVTLTGPNEDRISTPSLPQTFELVGRDNNGTPVVKYGFTLKQWFVNRRSWVGSYFNALSWCNDLGYRYRVPSVKDLTNASCRGNNSGSHCQGAVGAIPSSPNNYFQRHIGSGFFAEWGAMYGYSGAGFADFYYWTSNWYDGSFSFVLDARDGDVYNGKRDPYVYDHALCAYP